MHFMRISILLMSRWPHSSNCTTAGTVCRASGWCCSVQHNHSMCQQLLPEFLDDAVPQEVSPRTVVFYLNSICRYQLLILHPWVHWYPGSIRFKSQHAYMLAIYCTNMIIELIVRQHIYGRIVLTLAFVLLLRCHLLIGNMQNLVSWGTS